MRQWRGRKSRTEQSGNELCLCVEVLQLLFHRNGIRIARGNFATDAPETGSNICASTGVTKHNLKRPIIERETDEQLTADDAATSLVHRLFRRSHHRGTDVTRLLICRSVEKHGQVSHFLRRNELGGLLKVFHQLTAGGTKTKKGSLSRFRDFDITTWVVAARLGVVEAAYPGEVTLRSWPGLWLPHKWCPVASVIRGQIGGGGKQPI